MARYVVVSGIDFPDVGDLPARRVEADEVHDDVDVYVERDPWLVEQNHLQEMDVVAVPDPAPDGDESVGAASTTSQEPAAATKDTES